MREKLFEKKCVFRANRSKPLIHQRLFFSTVVLQVG